MIKKKKNTFHCFTNGSLQFMLKYTTGQNTNHRWVSSPNGYMYNVILSLKAQDTHQKGKRDCKRQRNKKFTYLLEMTGKFYPRCLNKIAA